jgi:general stress protein 26
MISTIFSEIKSELNNGITEYGHPFRFFTLGTTSINNSPNLRTVVFRDFSENLNVSFFTDERSEKVAEIIKNPKISILLYHPEKRVQLKIEGNASIIKDDKTIAKYWNNIDDNSKNDYTTILPPGSRVKKISEVEYLNNENYFCAVTIQPQKIEYLKLAKPNHIKIKYTKEGDLWNGEFLVP